MRKSHTLLTRSLPRLLLVALILTIAGCVTVGPNYEAPQPEMPAQFDQSPPLDDASESAVVDTDPWRQFKSEELDRLIERALDANTSIGQALARFEETLALSGLSIYSLFPTFGVLADAERSGVSSDDPFAPPDQQSLGVLETWRAGFDMNWEIDLFGSLKSQSNAIGQRAEADAAAYADIQITIVAETAQAWFALLGARQQVALQQQQLSNLEESEQLLRTLLDNGRGTELDVARAETETESLRAQLALAQAEVVRQEQRLAVLTAWPVDTLRQALNPNGTLPSMPAFATAGDPANWLRRRPDIRSAERRLAAATSDIGVEMAEFFPKLELLGSFGWTAQNASGLGSSAAERWGFGPSISWRILDFGRIRQRVRAADAVAAQALAAYDETVLTALEETETALANFRAQSESEAALNSASAAASHALSLAELRFEAGVDNFLTVLDAQRTALDLEREVVRARTDQATALARLYKALAGGFGSS
ncbi:MAG: TolC family protein [Pseudomonadota bacterium]